LSLQAALKIVGLMAAAGGASAACGGGDSGQGGSAADAGGGAVADTTDPADGTEQGSAAGASASGADAQVADGAPGDGSSAADAGGGDGANTANDGADGAGVEDAAVDAGADANGETLVIRVDPRNDCTVTTIPPSPIRIAAGQWFHATFINVGEI